MWIDLLAVLISMLNKFERFFFCYSDANSKGWPCNVKAFWAELSFWRHLAWGAFSQEQITTKFVLIKKKVILFCLNPFGKLCPWIAVSWKSTKHEIVILKLSQIKLGVTQMFLWESRSRRRSAVEYGVIFVCACYCTRAIVPLHITDEWATRETHDQLSTVA